MRSSSAMAVLLMLVAQMCSAQKLNVKIIDRKDGATSYTYVVPGHSKSHSSGTVNCTGDEIAVNCSGVSESTGSQTPAQVGSYQVRGATFSLQLPDGRIAVVNCDSKPNWGRSMARGAVADGNSASGNGDFRSCRTPIRDDIQAEFKGNKAKLKWPVSIDGKKMESETYKILGVLDKPLSDAR